MSRVSKDDPVVPVGFNQNPNGFHLNAIRLIAILCVLLVPEISNAMIDGDSESKPNVLLIITDEHNFRTLGCYRQLMPREQGEMWGIGNIVRTPNIDRIAHDGVICTRAYATAPVCTPCRAAIFTGRYPHMTGAPKNNLVLDRSIPTIADRLKEAGYRTGYIGKWHLGGEGKPEWSPKVDGGFEFKKYMFNRGHWKKFALKDGVPSVVRGKNGKPVDNAGGADEKTFATDWLTDRAIEYIADPKQDKPFFTVVSYPDPHGPNRVRAPYNDRFDGLSFTAPRTFGVSDGKPTPKWLGAKMKHDAFKGDQMSQYFGMVQCIDDNIGRLIEHLRESKKLDNTLVIFTSDHGDLCYEHDRLNKGNPYEGSARVPMLLRLPERISANKFYTQPIGSVDLTPTILGFLGLPADPEDRGRDLSAELADANKTSRTESNEHVTFLRAGGKIAPWVAAVDARYKLVLSTADEPWLFDAKEDPDELENFCQRPSHRNVALRLAKALKRYGKECSDPSFKLEPITDSLDRLLSSNVQPSKPFRMGTCDWTIKMPLTEDSFHYAKRVGLRGIQYSFGAAGDGLDLRTRANRDKIRSIVKETGVEIASLGIALLNKVPLATTDQADQLVLDCLAAMASMKEEAAELEDRELAAKVAPHVVLLGFFGKANLNGNPQGIETVIRKLKRLAPIAEEHGFVLGLETLLNEADHRHIIDSVGSPAVKVYYDTANSARMGYDIYSEIKSLGVENICEVHIKENGALIGEGAIDFEKVKSLLVEIGYEGWLIVEGSIPKKLKQDRVKANELNVEFALDFFGGSDR